MMTDGFSRSVVVALLAGSVVVGGSFRPPLRFGRIPAQPSRCEDFVPRPLSVDSFSIYIDSPEVTRTTEGYFVTGWPAFAATTRGKRYSIPGVLESTQPIGARIAANGTLHVLPQPTNQGMFNPRAVVDPRGMLNVLWVDADSSGNSGGEGPIMWSVLSGSRWSPPDSVRATASLGIWRPTTVSSAVTSDSAVFLVATFGVAPSRTRAIQWNEGKWFARQMPEFEGAYLSFAGQGDTVVAVFLGYGAPDGNAVFAVRSIDGRKTYSERVRVSPPQTGRATDMRVFRLKTGRFVAVWVAQGATTSNLRSAYSDDGAVTWIVSRPFVTGANVLSLRAATTSTDKVVLIAQVGDTRRVVPTYLEWKNGEWSVPRRFIADRNSSSSLGVANIAGGDSVLMAWGQYAPGDKWPVTHFIALPANCRQ